jgi:translation initiation factor 1
MARKRKLDLAPTGTGLNNPFAGLEVGGLPVGQPVQSTRAAPEPPKPGKLGRVVLRRETAHRGGKTVIVIHDFAPHIGISRLESLAAKLKAACGCGGTVKDRTIEIQGDQPVRIRSLLEQEGFRVAGVT